MDELTQNGYLSQAESAMEIKRAKNAGAQAARRGGFRPTEERLQQKKGYSPMQVKAYLESFDERASVMTDEERLIRRIKEAGSQAGRQGKARQTEENLRSRYNYTAEQINIYWESYDATKQFIENKNNANISAKRNLQDRRESDAEYILEFHGNIKHNKISMVDSIGTHPDLDELDEIVHNFNININNHNNSIHMGPSFSDNSSDLFREKKPGFDEVDSLEELLFPRNSIDYAYSSFRKKESTALLPEEREPNSPDIFSDLSFESHYDFRQ